MKILYRLSFLVLVAGLLVLAPTARAAGPTPVMVYSQAGASDAFNLFIKVGDADPIELASFTEVPQTPAYRLSYSKKLLALNFGNSIQVIDLKTKAVKTLLTTTGTFDSLTPPTAGVAITTDDQFVLAIERTLGPNEAPPGSKLPDEQISGESVEPSPTRPKYTYTIHYVNIKTGQDRILRRATVEQVMIPRFFRTDGLALFLTPAGALKLFDVQRKAFLQPKFATNTRLFSGDGIAMPVAGETVVNACGAKPKGYTLVDYRTGKTLGFVKTQQSYVQMIAISPNKDAVLFSSTGFADAAKRCVYRSARYFVADLKTGEVTETKDYLGVMRDYDAWYIGAREGSQSADGALQYVINVNGSAVVRSATRLTVAAQYWLKNPSAATPKEPAQVNNPE